ncbi:YibE/F family protein [Candidatus Giovannonibacteria bacterium]|nr:YibE/F family protein [Candidatus Giovannonibacteria bacterium]
MAERLTFLFLFVLAAFPLVSTGQELYQDTKGTFRAKVLEIISEEKTILPVTETEVLVQTLSAEILDGNKKGEIITIENDFVKLSKGDEFFVNYLVTIDGQEIYSVFEPDRRQTLWIFLVIFMVVVIFFGGFQGIRSLFSLAAGFFVIIYFLLPSILRGVSPLLAGIGFSILILAFAMYLTHGFKRRTHAAFIGTVLTIIIVGILASLAVSSAKLSGFASDEAVYLNLDTRGKLNFAELLVVAIIIGALGILDDIAITQASVIETLKNNLPDIKRRKAYLEALKVGREHVGALVNTLALAYVGASLPLLLLFYGTDQTQSWSIITNREIFATEIIRTIAGSIGLILAVPITTALAVLMLIRKS